MPNRAINLPADLLREDRVTVMALRVYGCLGDATGDPTFEEMAKLTGCYRSQVQKGIAWLEKHGWLSVTHRHCLGNQYKIHTSPHPTSTCGNTTHSSSTTSSGPTTLTRDSVAIEPGTEIALSDHSPSLPSSSLPSPSSNGSSKKTEKNNAQLTADFLEFYDLFPKHVSKKGALPKYKAARKSGATKEDLLEGARRYKVSVAETERKYIQAPDVWLNKGRWEDESVEAVPQYSGTQEEMRAKYKTTF